MTEPIDLLVLSPHLDDAILSLGALLHHRRQQGERVVVLTLATASPELPLSPLAQELHRDWGLGDDAMARRRQEDLEACAELDLEAWHWDEPDALYRRTSDGAPLYPTLDALFGPPVEDDPTLEHLTKRLRALSPATTLCAPLSIGGHIDHRLTRAAAERVFGRDLAYYEDFPYAQSFKARFRTLGFARGLRSHAFHPEATDLEAKCRALACYCSQMGSAFPDHDTLRAKVQRFAERRGERLWHPT